MVLTRQEKELLNNIVNAVYENYLNQGRDGHKDTITLAGIRKKLQKELEY